MKNGRARVKKGARGMAEAAKLLTSIGFPAERARGMKDIYCESLPNVHVEVKDVAGMRIGSAVWFAAIQQAGDEARDRGKAWALLWRCIRGGFALTTRGTMFAGPETVTLTDSMRQRLKWLNDTPALVAVAEAQDMDRRGIVTGAMSGTIRGAIAAERRFSDAEKHGDGGTRCVDVEA